MDGLTMQMQTAQNECINLPKAAGINVHAVRDEDN